MPMLVSMYYVLVYHIVRIYHSDFQTVHSDLFPPLLCLSIHVHFIIRPFQNSFVDFNI
jgi:hypothetical protein